MIVTLQPQGQTQPLRDRSELKIRRKLLATIQRQLQERQNQSLHQVVLATLGSEQALQSPKYPCDLNVKISGRRTFALSPDDDLSQLLAENSGTWAILGQSGAGKTTLILDLALSLITRAQTDSSQPIPVLLDLMDWTAKHDLGSWIVAKLLKTYQLPPEYSQPWLKQGEFFLLLDGLDRLELAQQEDCLQAIQERLSNPSHPPNLIFCTRLEDYRSCPTKLQLKGAVLLQPLSYAQIQDYLMNARSRELWHNIKKESHLLKLGNAPLLLSVLALSYEEILIHSWKRIESSVEQYHYLLNAFVRRMLTIEVRSREYRPGKEPRPELTRSWLAILAQEMQREQAESFCPEQLQPSWLMNRREQRLYRLGVGLGMGTICAGVAGVAIALSAGLTNGIAIALVAGGLGLVAGLTQKTDRIALPDRERLCASTLWKTLVRLPGATFVCGLIVGPALGLSLGMGLRYSPLVGGMWALVWCVLFGLLWWAMRALTPDIDTPRSPNQGIRQAVGIAGAIAPLASLIVALVCGVGLGLVTEPSFGLMVGLISGLVTWFLLAFESLTASIQHFILRLILVKNGKLPWNYSRFLNYATSHHLLQRVNGRYSFIHELIQTHFLKC